MSDASKSDRNPFTESDQDRQEIWNILMVHDFEAFVQCNWSLMEHDFWDEGFFGIDARGSQDPDDWTITFPTLDAYRDEWLRQARQFNGKLLTGTSLIQFLYDSCSLQAIEIAGDRAIGHKKFSGSAITTLGEEIVLAFQSIYQLVRRNGRWLISGFVGYLPNP